MASLHATNPLITHTFTGANAPAEGTLIKLRFAGPLQGPGSMRSLGSVTESNNRSLQSLTNVTKSSGRSPMHSALVLSATAKFSRSGDRILEIECYPVVSFHNSPDPVLQMAKAEGYENFVHVPIPSVPTPTLFGNPLVAGGYINNRACWIQVSFSKVTLKEGQKWKSFEPEVTFSREEIGRLVRYEKELHAHFSPSETPSDGRFLDDHLDFTPDGDSFDEDDDEPLYESVADFFRIFPREQSNKHIELIIQQDDARKSELIISSVWEWLEEVVSLGEGDWQE